MKKIFILSLILILFFTCASVFASDLNQTEVSSFDQGDDVISVENQTEVSSFNQGDDAISVENQDDIITNEDSNQNLVNSIDNDENLSDYEDDAISSSDDDELGSLNSGDYSVSLSKTVLSYQKGGTIDCSIDYYVSSISGTYGAEFYVRVYNSANSQIFSSKVSVKPFVKYGSCNVGARAINPGEYNVKIVNTKDSKVKATSTLIVVDSTDNNYNSFRSEVSSVSSGGTLYLDKDYVFEGNLNSKFTINKEITIDGRGHTVDANYSNGIFSISADNVVIKNVIFKNVYSTTSGGGAIAWNGKYGKLTNCTFINNHATAGGAVYWNSYQAEMSDCNFINNSATNGGAFYLAYYSVVMSNCKFIDNSATNNGGAMNLYAFQTNRISNFVFINNTASNGGAIYSTVENGGLKVSGSLFNNNNASNYGGAINAYWIEISDCDFNSNYASCGGALSLGYYTYNTIADCNFNNNVADNGSAIKLTKYLCPTNCYFNGQNKNYNKYFYIENKLSPELSVNAYDIHLNEVLNIEASFASNINGNLSFNLINTRTGAIAYSSYSLLDGTLSNIQLSVPNLKSGKYLLYVDYYGDNLFNATSITQDLEVIGLPSNIEFEVNNISWGDSIVISPKLTTGATGLIDIYVNGEYLDTISVGSNYELQGLGGPYSTVTLNYLGDDVYRSSEHSEKINVKRLNSTMNISEIESGKLSTVNITLNEDATGKITVNFNGKKYSGNLQKGTFTFNTPNLKSGNMNINIIYNGDSKYDSFNVNNQVNVILKESPIDFKSTNYLYSEDKLISPKVSGSLGKFEIYIDGEYEAVFNEGNTYTLPNLDLGKHTVRLVYLDGVYYANTEYLTSFTVYNKYPIEFTVKPIIFNSGENFYAKFYDEYGNVLNNKYVIFNINGDNYSTRTDSKGIAYIPTELEIGEYNVTIINPVVNENATVNLLIFTSIESENMLVDKNTDFEFKATFFDNEANELVNTPIIFKINNEEKIINTNNDGVAILKLNLGAGTYEIYSTNTITNENKVNKIFVVSNVASLISVDNISDINYGEKAIVKINVNPNYLNGHVEIKVSNDCDFEYVFNRDASTLITQELSNLGAGEYVVEIKYTNDEGMVFNSIKSFKVFKIDPIINVTAKNIYVGDDAEIIVKIQNSDGVLTLKVNNISYYEELYDGLLVKTIPNLPIGKYVVEVSFFGDDNYNPLVKNTTFNVYYNLDEEVIVPSLNDSSDGSVTIKVPVDAEGEVTLTINGKKYNFAVVNGKIDINIPDLPNGNYDYDIAYSGDSKYSPFLRTGNLVINNILPTTIIASAVITVYNGNKFLVITLKDSEGNAIKGAKLSINLNGIKNINTDSNGQVKLTTNGLSPKTYTVKVTFNGDNNYYKSTKEVKVTVKKATPKLTAKAKTFKKSVKTKKYSITLKTNQNKVMKNTKVTIKVNKKTYTAKTNSKGVATFKITKLTKKGTFKAVITYKGNTYYNKVTKKVNIKVK